MAHFEKNICCDFCDYKTNKRYNLTRHVEIKHIEQKNNLFEQKNNLRILHNNQCEKCEKILSSKQNYNRHIQTCQGKRNLLECIYCKTIFSIPQARYRHQKICKIKLESTSTELILKPLDKLDIAQHIETQQNIQTQQYVQNQQNITIVYDPEKLELLNDHLQDKLKSFLKHPDNKTNFCDYSKELMGRKENQCIKKSNIRSSHSEVHIGNNNWELRLDKEIYPGLISNIADNFSECFNTDQKHSRQHKLFQAFLDYMADFGYCNSDDPEEITNNKKDFEMLTQQVKTIIYNITRKSKDKEDE